MKVEQSGCEVQSTMTGERIAMSIQAEDMAHIMGIMTDLYEDRLLAVIREYSTNALDAHIEAGVALPIEVTLPSPLAPTLTIRDYGVGLSADDIRTIYSQYGRSTKRATNDQVGMLGLGCKSALTYTQQFTVTSVKDGRRVTVLVARDQDGAGSMQVLGDEATDEANGTEVSVAIRREDLSRAESHCKDFFSYWQTDAVLINGEPPVPFEGLRITDDLYIVTGQSKVVMGNVAYPRHINIGTSRYSDVGLVAYVPIGSVKPTPSREALMDTPATEATVRQIEESYQANIAGAIQREVDKADSPQAAVRIVVEWSRSIPGAPTNADSYVYRGERLPATLTDTTGEYILTNSLRDYGRRRAGTIQNRDLAVRVWPGTLFVHGFEPGKFTPQHKDKLLKWCSSRNIGQRGEITQFALLRGDKPDSKFIDPTLIVDWETIKAVKLDPKPRPAWQKAARIRGSFDILTEAGFQSEVPGDDLRQDKPLCWVRGNRHSSYQQADALRVLYPEFTLVLLTLNRVEKFQRDVPVAMPLERCLSAGYKQWRKAQSRPDLLAVAMRSAGIARYCRNLDASRVDDPAIRKAISLSARDTTQLEADLKTLRWVMRTADAQPEVESPFAAYPLYDPQLAAHDHTYLYLNAAYAARSTPQS